MVITMEQAKSWAKRTFNNIFYRRRWDALWWGYCTIDPVSSDWDYEHDVTKEELIDIRDEARKATRWAVEKKFGKHFKHGQLFDLFKYVEGLH